MPNLWRIDPESGSLSLSFHPGQSRAWDSGKRFVFVIAGTQSGKTSWGPWWLWREIRETADPRGLGNDYIAATSTYDLFKLKMLPALRDTFENITQWGRYWSADRIIELSDPATGRFWAKRSDDPMWGRIILRAASSGGGLESTTARAAWLDECGQPEFQIVSWEAVLRRLSLSRGRVLGTTTPYDLGWLKTIIWDAWKAAGGGENHPDIQVVRFDSTENPIFSEAEFERARATMPGWRFDLFYRGLFTRPAGSIYDCFIDELAPAGHLCKPFEIPPNWSRVLGLDFGGVNTAGVFLAEDPATRLFPHKIGSGHLYVYRTYLQGGKTAAQHAAALREGEPGFDVVVGGSHSEGQWRQEFGSAGMVVLEPPIKDVEVGIDRVYGLVKSRGVSVFENLVELRKQVMGYKRVLDDAGEPTEKIRDKEKFHYLDAKRYITAYLRDNSPVPVSYSWQGRWT